MSVLDLASEASTPLSSTASVYSPQSLNGSGSGSSVPLTPLTPAPGLPRSMSPSPSSVDSFASSLLAKQSGGGSSFSSPSLSQDEQIPSDSPLQASPVGSAVSDAFDLETYYDDAMDQAKVAEDSEVRKVRFGEDEVFEVDRLGSEGSIPQTPVTPWSPLTPPTWTKTPPPMMSASPSTPLTSFPPSVPSSLIASDSGTPPPPLTPWPPSIPSSPTFEEQRSRDFRDRETNPDPTPPKIKLTKSQEALRLASLYLVPVLLTIPLSLLLHTTTQILAPLYTISLVSIHQPISHIVVAVISSACLFFLVLRSNVKKALGARVCLTVIALSGDLTVAFGRKAGYLSAGLLGPEWGAVLAMTVLNFGSVLGASAFALLCFEHALPIAKKPLRAREKAMAAANISFRVAIYALHIFYAEKTWGVILGPASFVGRHPEKMTLFISLTFTLLSLFVRQDQDQKTAHAHSKLYGLLAQHLDLPPKASLKLKEATDQLPHSISPILFLLRLPLLILALRQQIFLRSYPPFAIAGGDGGILSSLQGTDGSRVVVGDSLAGGYRYLRKDGVILGGRFARQHGNSTELSLGDSIFPGGMLIELGLLAARHSESDSLARTMFMTTELQLVDEEEILEEDRPRQRALVLGVGSGVSSVALTRRSLAVDIVEQDEAVYKAVENHFNLKLGNDSTTSMIPADVYIDQITEFNKEINGTMIKWSYVFHDLASAVAASPSGILGPLHATGLEGYTREFWIDLVDLVDVDGIVSIMIPGTKDSRLRTRILVTVLSTFTQCRAFADPPQKDGGQELVLVCTMAYSPLLSFRRPRRFDVLRSPLRSHIYSHFHEKEIPLTDLVSPSDFADREMIFTRANLVNATIDINTITQAWRQSKPLLPSQMWLSW